MENLRSGSCSPEDETSVGEEISDAEQDAEPPDTSQNSPLNTRPETDAIFKCHTGFGSNMKPTEVNWTSIAANRLWIRPHY
ncbi:hypothetical protein Y1Q_0020586 [Alligator mississippiensis]|uniref:Uncharacterized protein n=1 Tax=Alligator mississippiensis TaxID=8496 RepID=A0A151PJ46_ALLMI|nr:hypothetical protein Y1Q_0020586 [Alligator mississippiensis]